MSEIELKEMNQEDSEVIGMVQYNQRRRLLRDAHAAEVQEDEALSIRQVWANRIVGCMFRCCAGIIFGGAIAEGLIDPLFGGICVAACIGWGVAFALGGKRDA